MIEIKILFIVPYHTRDKIIELFQNDYSLSFIAIDHPRLKEHIKDYDIQVVIIDDDMGTFSLNLYKSLESQFISVYFNQIKIDLNNIKKEKLKSIKEIKSLKERLNYSQPQNLFDTIKDDISKMIMLFEKNLKPKLPSTYLEAIKIKDYFSIKDMEIDDLAGNKEIYFVGENGDGKTVLLQAIVLALKGDDYEILAEDYIKDIKSNMQLFTKDSVYPHEYKKYKKVQNIFAYGINRNKISSNEEETKITSYSGLFDTPSIYKTTLLRDAENFLEQETALVNDFKAQMHFLMDDKFEIIKTEKGLKYGDIEQFSMLSEGYKTTLIWLSDLLSRMIENQPKITELKDFQAIVLIDEVDLYLHPKWKYEFMYKLRKIFPKIQFIMTTHSLVTVLGASEDAVFYKVYKEDGYTKVSEKIDDISYYTSDILMSSPLFNLSSITSRSYNDKLSNDDYVYNRIHKKVKERLANRSIVQDDEVDKWLDEEFELEFGKDFGEL